MIEATPVLAGAELVKEYSPRGSGIGLRAGRRLVRVVDHVDVKLPAGGSIAIVGESGAGKTTVGRILAHLERPTAGSILVDGRDVTEARGADLKAFHRRVQIVFQNPYESLDPRHPVRIAVEEPLDIHGGVSRSQGQDRVRRALELVGLTPVEQFLDRFPHELSGGQRQRVAIARAIILEPDALIADEPVSMLDASVRSSILNLLSDLRAELDLAVLFITHDLATARFLSEQLYVMYAGQVVEKGPIDDVLEGPAHPYTRLLMAASAGRVEVAGNSPPPQTRLIDSACRFAARCPLAQDICRTTEPPVSTVATGHWSRCHFAAVVRESASEPIDQRERK